MQWHLGSKTAGLLNFYYTITVKSPISDTLLVGYPCPGPHAERSIMALPIKILHLEDDPADAELIQANLTDAGLPCRITIVRTRETFETALGNNGMDIILADYCLKAYDGLSALKLAQELCPALPFIFVTGSMGEDAAITALTQGATDYVLKHNLSRLTAAIQRALREFRERREREKTQAALQRTNEMLRAIIEAAPVAIIGLDQDEQVDAVWNPAAEKMLGWRAQEVMGKPPPTVSADQKGACGHLHTLIHQDKAQKGAEVRWQRRDAVPIECGTYVSPLYDTQGRPSGSIAVLVDITAHKQAESERLANLWFFESMDKINLAIQRAKGLEQMMQDVLDAVLSILDCDRVFLMYPCDPDSPTWSSPMERTKPEYPGVLDLKLEIPMDPQVAETLRILLAADGPVTFGPGGEHPLPEDVSEQFGFKCFMSMAIHPKIGGFWQFGIHQCTHVRQWTAEEKRLFQEIGRRLADALTSLLSFRDLRKNEAFLDMIVDHIPNMIFVKDAQTLEFVRFNKAGEQLVGYPREALLGKTDYEFFPKEEADFFSKKDRQVLAAKVLVDIPEETIRTKRKEKRILHTKKLPLLDETGKPQYLLGIAEDITEKKKLEERYRQAQKMEAIGQLAGGVAHDFNNMLGVIMGYAELALEKAAGNEPLQRQIAAIRDAGYRSAEITRQLLAFARKQTIRPKSLDLNKTVERMLKLLRRLIGEDIDLVWQPGSDLWPIKMDPSQVDQILANLCVNARDAITGVGRVTIETQKVVLDEIYCDEHAGASPGDYVMLAVSDDGSGMDNRTRDKIFEPFFTTKELGKGTGLGLATVYGIVKQNNGLVYVYSEPEYGSTFRIYLPRHRVKREPSREATPPTPRLRGDEAILLVEDEPTLLELVRLVLERFGYKVLATSKPEEAIAMASKNADNINLLITDLVMPKMTGRDLLKHLTPICPNLKCLYMSGYTGRAIASQGVLEEGVNFIQKPFSKAELATKVREILDRK
jgi:PAS domain S-box-containing protein